MTVRTATILHNTWMAGVWVSMVVFFGLMFSDHSTMSVWAALAALICFALMLLGPAPGDARSGSTRA